MAKRKSIRTAGRLVTGVIYTVSRDRDTEAERSAKINISNSAREKMNLRCSWQKLEIVLAANFSYSDMHVTLTYDNDNLPGSRADAVKILRKFIRQLRELRCGLTGEALLYVYVTEGNHGLKRIHHHIVINATGNDLQQLRQLWTYGSVKINAIGAIGYTKLAQYLTKEPRDGGKWRLGERTWTPCKGLKRPTPDKGWVPENFTLTPPPGALILLSETRQNPYGEFTYLKYLLPEPPTDLPKEYHRPRPQRKTDRI